MIPKAVKRQMNILNDEASPPPEHPSGRSITALILSRAYPFALASIECLHLGIGNVERYKCLVKAQKET